MFLKVLGHLLVLFAAACTSSSVVKLSSVPDGATVTSTGPGGTRVLGKTPLQVDSTNLPGEGRFSSLSLNKEGHKDHHILLGRDRGSENYEIAVNLQLQGDDPKVTDARGRQEKLAKLLLQGHALTAAKKYQEADRVLSSLLQEYPHISAGYDLMGNLAYLQKDLKTALSHYERSLQINPENGETKQMVDRLKGMLQ